ncbi:MAG: phosphoglycerate mutase family protein [Cyclobacteriaceae bacterium]
MRYFLISILWLLVLSSCQPSKEPTTLVIVRHAEKISSGDDPGLTPIGQDRADRLAEMLERHTIAAVYSTPYQRTRLTGAPTAKDNDLEVTEYDPSKAEDFLKEVINKHRGETILITGHSNTVPAMVNMLTGSSLENFSDSDYGNLFVITGSELGSCSSVNLFY